MEKIQELAMAMIRYNNAAPNRIQHTTKEHAYAAMIGHGEGLDGGAAGNEAGAGKRGKSRRRGPAYLPRGPEFFPPV